MRLVVQILFLTILLENIAFPWGHIVVPAESDLVTGAEKALPSSDWISPNHRAGAAQHNISQARRDLGQDFFQSSNILFGFEIKPCVLRGTTVILNEILAKLLLHL